MRFPRRGYRQAAYIAVFIALFIWEAYFSDVGLVGFLVGFLAMTLLFFDRDWKRKGAWFSPF